MSVIVMLHIDGDPDKLEEFASANKDKMAGIVERAKGKGLIAHRFYGDDEGVVVLDEWPDAESFQSFFGEAQDEIGSMMQEVGVTSEPRPRFLRALETHDRYGWGA
jgi:hypothetical protein